LGRRSAGSPCVPLDTIWAFVQTLGMRLANAAVDSTWSALRIEAQQQSTST